MASQQWTGVRTIEELIHPIRKREEWTNDHQTFSDFVLIETHPIISGSQSSNGEGGGITDGKVSGTFTGWASLFCLPMFFP